MKAWVAYWSILSKDVRSYYLKPPNISWGIVFPLAWTLMFFIKSDSAVDLRSLLPGVMALSVLFGTTSMLAVTVTFEKKGRSFERLLLAPISFELLMLAKTSGAVLFGVANACVPLIMASFLVDLAGVIWWQVFVAVVLVAVSSAFLGLFVAVSVSEVFEAQTFSNFFRFPMLFLCGLFFPIEKTTRTAAATGVCHAADVWRRPAARRGQSRRDLAGGPQLRYADGLLCAVVPHQPPQHPQKMDPVGSLRQSKRGLLRPLLSEVANRVVVPNPNQSLIDRIRVIVIGPLINISGRIVIDRVSDKANSAVAHRKIGSPGMLAGKSAASPVVADRLINSVAVQLRSATRRDIGTRAGVIAAFDSENHGCPHRIDGPVGPDHAPSPLSQQERDVRAVGQVAKAPSLIFDEGALPNTVRKSR